MTAHRLKKLSVDRRPDLLIYDHSMGGDAFLEELEGEDCYVVRLKRGQYDHNGLVTGPGRVSVELFDAPGWTGLVVSTDPEVTQDGENSPPQIELKIVRDNH